MATGRMTPRLPGRWPWWAVGVAVMVLAIVVALANLGGSTPAGSSTQAGYQKRTVEAGAVTVTLQIRSIDTTKAVLDVAFDTHSVALDADVARQARLVVAGIPWPVAAWSGDGAGGHHREGRLQFTAAGPVTGTVTLTITGLPRPVSASWQVTP